uniref:Uncharacterized protein n=2 Tax=unclassified Caudoviricetes TaxID=2788787 RepID=A0A8S5PS81_9CAUD|nr:MAG TPA: hypothetical protein [Siphoviridae sp. ctL1i33]DAE12080.1 MAG TPA: hypothetical protein [Siphoviridae sp. ctwIe6]
MHIQMDKGISGWRVNTNTRPTLIKYIVGLNGR